MRSEGACTALPVRFAFDFSLARLTHLIVMAGLVPAIHALRATSKDVDARDVGAKQSFVASPGHDAERCDSSRCFLTLRQVTPSHSRGANAPEVCENSPPFHGKGVGNAGCRRTRSLACKVKKHTS